MISLMVKRHAVEFLERIIQLAIGGCKARIHGNALHFGRMSATNVDTSTLLHIAEVDRVGTGTSLVWDHGRLHVTYKSPLGRSEEGMGLNIRGTSASSETLSLVLDEQLADQRLA